MVLEQVIQSLYTDILVAILDLGCSKSQVIFRGRRGKRTRRDIVVRFDGDVLDELYIVDGLENG